MLFQAAAARIIIPLTPLRARAALHGRDAAQKQRMDTFTALKRRQYVLLLKVWVNVQYDSPQHVCVADRDDACHG